MSAGKRKTSSPVGPPSALLRRELAAHISAVWNGKVELDPSVVHVVVVGGWMRCNASTCPSHNLQVSRFPSEVSGKSSRAWILIRVKIYQCGAPSLGSFCVTHRTVRRDARPAVACAQQQSRPRPIDIDAALSSTTGISHTFQLTRHHDITTTYLYQHGSTLYYSKHHGFGHRRSTHLPRWL